MANVLLIKGALAVGKSKTGRKIVGAILAVFLTIYIVIICAFSSLISIFTCGEKISYSFDAKTSEVYQDLRQIYGEYITEQRKELLEENNKCFDRHSYKWYEHVLNPETQQLEQVEHVASWALISWKQNYINSAYTLAYLSIKHHKSYLSDKKNIKIDKEEVIDFWDEITEIVAEEDYTEGGQKTVHIYNSILTVEEIAEECFFFKSSKKQFIESVHIISQLIGVEDFGEYIRTEGNKMDIPLFYQYQQPWGNVAYGSRTIAKSGCGPTCIAMVFSYLKGYTITPADIVEFTQNRYYVPGAGSSYQIFEGCAKEWNVICTNVGTSQSKIVNALQNGQPVILSMGPGTFTSGGHFIVLTGIEEGGKVTVNDPNDNEKKKHYGKKFSLSQVLREAKGGWSFEGE